MINNKFRNLKVVFSSIFIIKFSIFLYLINFIKFRGGDAETYHILAQTNNEDYIWGHILYFFNQLGLYNRTFYKYMLFFISSVCIPFMIAYIILKDSKERKDFFWLIVILSSLYPTLLIFSTDIYRDIVMLLLFLIDIWLIKMFFNLNSDFINSLKKPFIFIIIILFTFYLFKWRHYLGFSLLFAISFYKLLDLKIFSLKFFFIFYMIGLIVFYHLGYFDDILVYREAFLVQKANTTLGLDLYHKDIFEFLYLYFQSVLYQLFGLFFVNKSAIALFLLETVPFVVALIYIYKKKNLISDFEKILLLFCVVYGTIWLLGNDNLGTAIRLRIFNYISIYMIAFSLMYKQKILSVK